MRIYLVLLTILAFTLPTLSQAVEPINEPHAMLYYKVSLGAKQANKSKHSFGFRMDRASYEPGQMIEYQALFNKPAALDFRFNNKGAESFTISGVDYLKLYRLQKASEEGSAEEDISVATEEPAGENTEVAEAEKKPNPAAKAAKDFGDTIGGVLEDTPKGYLIGVGIAIVLVAGVGG